VDKRVQSSKLHRRETMHRKGQRERQRERERERKRLGVKIAHDGKCKYADDSIPAGGSGCRLSCFRDRHLRIAVFAR